MRRILPVALLLAVACDDATRSATPSLDAGDDLQVDASQPDPDAGEKPIDAGVEEQDAGEDTPDASDEADAGEPEFQWPWRPGPTEIDPAWVTSPPACDERDWLAKYLNYRRRFRGDGTAAHPGFVSIGTNAGESVIASMRVPQAECDEWWWFVASACTDHAVPRTKGVYQFGDGTIWHGWYLTTLALEYAAFQKLGLPVDETIDELWHALEAFNRLDEAAESHYGLPGKRDGFFQRTDVPSDIVWKDAAHTELRFPRDEPGVDGYGCARAESTCGTPAIEDGFFESQDQAIGMLFGLAFVTKLLPDDVSFRDVGLRHEARAITHRIVKHLRDHNWKVVDPEGATPPNEWGGNAQAFSDQIARMANFISAPDFGVSDYRDLTSNTLGVGGMSGLDLSWDTQFLINQVMAVKMVAVTDDWTPDKLTGRATALSMPGFSLIHAILQDRAPSALESRSELESLLSSAPCSGPCRGTPGCSETPGWRGEHRIGDPDARNGDRNGFWGEYNGLDYMTLFNLYVVAYGPTYTVEPVAPAQPVACEGASTLGRLMNGETSVGTYDPNEACAVNDLPRTFCGRSWTQWLDAATRGEATLHVGTKKLDCSQLGPCVVTDATGGTAGVDLFLGTPGTDRFDGKESADCLMGFDGDDELLGGLGLDELHGGAGDDRLCGETCSLVELEGGPDQIFGGDGNDELFGGPGADDLFGDDGDDVIEGNAGDENIEGGEGNDVLRGGLGSDLIFGGPGDDELRGGAGDDKLYGDAGRDKLDGDLGDDFLAGGEGDDFLKGGDGDDTMWGEDGNDRLCGGCGRDAVNGGWNVDECRDKGGFCLQDPSNPPQGCHTIMSDDSKCKEADFNAW